jgi:hypothetical protein
MALRAITDDRDVLALHQAQVGVFVVVNLHSYLLQISVQCGVSVMMIQ